VDVVKQLNQEIRTEVRHLGRWLAEVASSNRQHQLLEDKIELQKNATQEAKRSADIAMTKSEERVTKVLAKAKEDNDRVVRASEARVAAAEKKLLEAKEKGTDPTILLKLMEVMLASQRSLTEVLLRVAMAPRQGTIVTKESPGEAIGAIMGGVSSIVSAATQKKPPAVNEYGVHQLPQTNVYSIPLPTQQYGASNPWNLDNSKNQIRPIGLPSLQVQQHTATTYPQSDVSQIYHLWQGIDHNQQKQPQPVQPSIYSGQGTDYNQQKQPQPLQQTIYSGLQLQSHPGSSSDSKPAPLSG
jgi:hypothetical protein